MCLITIAVKEHPDYPVILCANRDERHARPTKEAHYWHGDQNIIAGQDLEKGGSWLGITTNGRIAAVTNVRNGLPVEGRKRSRGEIVTRFLSCDYGSREYISELQLKDDLYQGYNTIVGSGLEDIYYYSNKGRRCIKIEQGVHTISNAQLNTSWPKTERARERVEKVIQQNTSVKQLIDDLLLILQDRTIFHDELLPHTGIGLELERTLSSIFIKGETYGTRASTVILFTKDKGIVFVEQTYGPNGKKIKLTKKVID